MDRLSILLTIMTGAVAAGLIVVPGFAMGYPALPVIILAAIVSVLVAWPVAYQISRRIKSQDPNWEKKPRPKALPDANAPEV